MNGKYEKGEIINVNNNYKDPYKKRLVLLKDTDEISQKSQKDEEEKVRRKSRSYNLKSQKFYKKFLSSFELPHIRMDFLETTEFIDEMQLPLYVSEDNEGNFFFPNIPYSEGKIKTNKKRLVYFKEDKEERENNHIKIKKNKQKVVSFSRSLTCDLESKSNMKSFDY